MPNERKIHQQDEFYTGYHAPWWANPLDKFLGMLPTEGTVADIARNEVQDPTIDRLPLFGGATGPEPAFGPFAEPSVPEYQPSDIPSRTLPEQLARQGKFVVSLAQASGAGDPGAGVPGDQALIGPALLGRRRPIVPPAAPKETAMQALRRVHEPVAPAVRPMAREATRRLSKAAPKGTPFADQYRKALAKALSEGLPVDPAAYLGYKGGAYSLGEGIRLTMDPEAVARSAKEAVRQGVPIETAVARAEKVHGADYQKSFTRELGHAAYQNLPDDTKRVLTKAFKRRDLPPHSDLKKSLYDNITDAGYADESWTHWFEDYASGVPATTPEAKKMYRVIEKLMSERMGGGR